MASKGRIVTTGSIAGTLSWAGGSAYSGSKHAIEAFTDALAAEMEPHGVSVSVVEPGNYKSNIRRSSTLRKLDRVRDAGGEVTDDMKKQYDQTLLVELPNGSQRIQIDLGAPHYVHAIIVWHYHASDRVYFDFVVTTAMDEEFSREVKTHYNNDHDNSSGLGAGKDKEYVESFQGRLVDAKGARARYVRLHTNGNTSNDFNHYIEVEVWGKPMGE